MWPFASSRKAYRTLENKYDEEDSIDLDDLTSKSPRWSPNLVIAALVLLFSSILLAGLSYFFLQPQHPPTSNSISPPPPSPTPSCALRREWRTLTRPEQDHYISSVRCLLTQPSRLHPEDSNLYEDFPWIHSRVGYFTHNSAPFLPWHRYFLHIYETALRQQCNFTGDGLVYWDWTQDWKALEHAPVFSAEGGFGGDGEVGGKITVGRTGRCVVDGPFNDIKPNFYDVKYHPHCLSRGFRDDAGNLGHMDGTAIRPESIEEVLQLQEYEKFVAEMESRVHDAIPFGIGGDFETFTAPYDPLFYLHHVQLDHLWYIWQQREPETRLSAYGGRNQRHSMEMAQLSDPIKMLRLAPEIQVSEVMNTEGKMLCYRY